MYLTQCSVKWSANRVANEAIKEIAQEVKETIIEKLIIALLQNVRDNYVKTLSVLTRHAVHIRDGRRLEYYQTWREANPTRKTT